jgi:hypothetical protein
MSRFDFAKDGHGVRDMKGALKRQSGAACRWNEEGGRGSSLRRRMKTKRLAVPDKVLSRLRSVCLGLPEAHEETAWVGVRWRIRTNTFAHVLVINAGWPPA